MKIESLSDLILALEEEIEPKNKEEIAGLEESALFQLHFGVNALIRSLAYYKNESQEGKALFAQLGFPDEGSSVLGKIYWLHLRGQPVTAQSLLRVIEENTIFLFGEPAKALATTFAKSYESLSGNSA